MITTYTTWLRHPFVEFLYKGRGCVEFLYTKSVEQMRGVFKLFSRVLPNG
jgi:hypothetical protein